ncbi:hypothetical protein [Streptomyces sp. NPDC049555]|uniref:hypothetical protein n=1 Tax=Streptomyces sp. NPDC049555 TaxID=3154930 RepID=UPI0034401ECF
MDSTTVFPDDLVQAQQEWYAAYEALAAREADVTALRRRLLRLSTLIMWHPHWTSPSGSSRASRVELRRHARAAELQTAGKL